MPPTLGSSGGGAEVAALVRTILDGTNLVALKSACDQLHATLGRLAGLPDDSQQSDDVPPRQLASGKAIAPRDAARCVLDIARTAMFMRGVRAAVADAARRFPGTAVEVLYAGCGPFAPLTLPLIVERGPDEVQITLVDVHERSLRAARQIYEQIGALAHVRTFAHADAAEYIVDPRWPLHVVVSETMQRALTREPHVAITQQLAPQLVPGGILVPERVTIDACLADRSKEFVFDDTRPVQRDRIPLGTVLVLSSESRGPFRPITVEVPDAGPRFDLQLLTTITVHGDMVLRDYDSGITFPLLISVPAHARLIEFRYQGGQNPGWQHRSLEPEAAGRL